MTPIDRNPDILLNEDEPYEDQIPSGMQLIEGKNLMHTARSAKIPFGVASQLNRETFNSRPQTVGLIIRDTDVERFNAAIEKKLARKLAESK
jgi:hypothetical protein